jgi:hypothetical protein
MRTGASGGLGDLGEHRPVVALHRGAGANTATTTAEVLARSGHGAGTALASAVVDRRA